MWFPGRSHRQEKTGEASPSAPASLLAIAPVSKQNPQLWRSQAPIASSRSRIGSLEQHYAVSVILHKSQLQLGHPLKVDRLVKVAQDQRVLLTVHQDYRRDCVLYVEEFVIVRVRIRVRQHFIPNV